MIRWILVLALLVTAIALEASAVKLEDTTVMLQSHKYYKSWDLTRLQYRVTTDRQKERPAYWVLEAESCLNDETVLAWASSPFEWVDAPFRGLRFDISRNRETFYVWLDGQWDVGSVDAAVVFESGGDDDDEEDDDDEADDGGDGGSTIIGEIDGPLCAGSAISVEVLSGATVEFPAILEMGRVHVGTVTKLRVTSTSAGWSLDHRLVLGIPADAREDVVRRVFEVDVRPFEAGSGTTEVVVSYALAIGEEDLMGLPEGSYVIAIAYTVAVDN